MYLKLIEKKALHLHMSCKYQPHNLINKTIYKASLLRSHVTLPNALNV